MIEHPYAIWRDEGDTRHVLWLGMASSRDDAWRIALGWPTRGEVKARQDEGFRAARIAFYEVPD